MQQGRCQHEDGCQLEAEGHKMNVLTLPDITIAEIFNGGDLQFKAKSAQAFYAQPVSAKDLDPAY